MKARSIIGSLLLLIAACKGGGETTAASTDTKAKPAEGAGAGAKPAAASGDITVGILADLTGATADVGKPYNEGMLAYIDNINAAGGIKGHKVNALSEDYAYKVPNAEEKYKKYVQA